MDKLAKRKVVINDVELYPLKKGFYVPFNDKLGMYMLYGRMLQAKLIQSTEGLGELIHVLTKRVTEQGYATTLLGRRVPAESSHVALNYHCQGMGAEAMKTYLTLLGEKLANFCPFTQIRHQATIYDEVDFIAREEVAQTLKEVLDGNYSDTSKYLGMKCTYTGETKVGRTWYDCH
jgi:DNA polymerase I-like protein with 3'-5' exonuclease and polymerase domains